MTTLVIGIVIGTVLSVSAVCLTPFVLMMTNVIDLEGRTNEANRLVKLYRKLQKLCGLEIR